MKVRTHIADDRLPEGWHETHSFACGTVQEAQQSVEAMVRKFNSSLRPGEMPRRLVSIEQLPQMPIERARELARDWNELLDQANGEESAECHGAAERLRMQALDIEHQLTEEGYRVNDLI